MTPSELGTLGVYVSAGLATISVVAFGALARFWRSRGGWLVFTDLLVIAWTLDLASIAHLWDPPWFAWTRVATFAVGFPIVLIWRLSIIFDLQLLRRPPAARAYRGADKRLADQEETHAA